MVDASSPTAWEQYEAVTAVLAELGCAGNQTLVLLNKIDAAQDAAGVTLLQHKLPEAMRISARSGQGLVELTQRVLEIVNGPPTRATMRVSARDGKAIHFLEKNAQVLDRRYVESELEMDIIIGASILHRYQETNPSVHIISKRPDIPHGAARGTGCAADV